MSRTDRTDKAGSHGDDYNIARDRARKVDDCIADGYRLIESVCQYVSRQSQSAHCRTRMLAACPPRCSALARAMIAGGVAREAFGVVAHDAAALEELVDADAAAERAVVLVGRQWLGPAT